VSGDLNLQFSASKATRLDVNGLKPFVIGASENEKGQLFKPPQPLCRKNDIACHCFRNYTIISPKVKKS
jgi:hypothetical protein